MMNALKAIWNFIVTALKAIWKFLTTVVKALWTAVKWTWSKLTTGMKKLFSLFVRGVKATWKGCGRAIKWLFKKRPKKTPSAPKRSPLKAAAAAFTFLGEHLLVAILFLFGGYNIMLLIRTLVPMSDLVALVMTGAWAIVLICLPWKTMYTGFNQKILGGGLNDIHIRPFVWNTLWRTGLSFVGSVITVGGLWLVISNLTWFVGVPNPLDLTIIGMLTVLLFLHFVRPEVGVEMVPETNFGALVTWYGTPTFLIRTSGPYTWRGERLLFGRSRKVSVTVTDADGFVILGPIPFQIWKSNSPLEADLDKTKMIVPAKNRALVGMRFTITLLIVQARKWIGADSPEITLGDQARQENQELIKDINDTDVPAIQADMDKFVQGKPIITCFTSESVEGHKEGAMIRDRAGIVMYTLPKEGEDVTTAIARFRKDLTASANKKMLATVRSGEKKKGAVHINVLRVSNPITEVLAALGAVAKILSFSDITASEIVSTAAARASSEADQRTAQLASMRTIAEGRKLLVPSKEETDNQTPKQIELGTILAASQDNPAGVKVVHVSGTDNNALAAATAAGASLIGANK